VSDGRQWKRGEIKPRGDGRFGRKLCDCEFAWEDAECEVQRRYFRRH
jgi:hypothetical protein